MKQLHLNEPLTTQTKAESSRTISFRLDPESVAKLEALAAEWKVSAGELARRIVLQSLDPTEPQVTGDDIEKTLGKINANLLRATQALLLASGKLTADEANRFISEKLLP